MKKLLVIVFSVSLGLSVTLLGNITTAAESLSAKAQIGYVKRKSKKVYYRSKHGTKVAYKKGKHETKKGFHKSKRATKHTYSKTKDKVTN